MRMLRRIPPHLLGYLCILIALFLMIDPAFAQGIGGAGSFRCSNGQGSGTLYDSGSSCPTTLHFNNVFSFLVCNMEKLTSNVLGNMICGMVYDLAPAFLALVTMAVLFQGVTFTLGMNARASARDLQLFLIKMAALTAFATQADYIIDISYNFFMSGMRDGILTVLSNLMPATANTADAANLTGAAKMYALLDNFLGAGMKFATDYIGAREQTPASGQTVDYCKNAVFVVMAIMAVAFPPIFYISLMIIFRIALTILRAVFSYIYAMLGIAFLLVMSPIFLGFALFRQTQPLFEKWVGYMASFALQVILLFAFLSFILSIDVKHISSSLPDVIRHVENPQETTSIRMPWEYCTLCEFKVVDKTDHTTEITNSADFISKGELKCNTPLKTIKVLEAAAPGNTPNAAANQQQVLNTLMSFATVGLMSLLILAYVVETLLTLLPSIAQKLAGGFGGATYAPQIGGGMDPYGRTTIGMPGESLIDQTFGRDGQNASIGTFGRGLASESNSVSGTVKGVRESIRGLVTGQTSDGRGTGEGGERGGLPGAFRDFLADPNRID